jgi:hypothetical protein
MAKRKAGRSTGRGKATKKARSARNAKAVARKVARKPAKTKVARKKAVARKVPKRKAVARKAPNRKAVARKAAPTQKAAPRRNPGPARVVTRKAPAFDRQRRTVVDDDIVASPPSSLDLDRTASAARSGRRELSERFREHTETSPALTGGDIDADWESAYSVGDEAPGGDNPTPDQDIVDDIGKAIGVVYEDNEELKGEKKISDRDKKRWELDPASSDDYEDR